jgi:hypothetical protein
MNVKAVKGYFVYTSDDSEPVSKEMYNTNVKKHKFLLSMKSNEVTFFGRTRVICILLPYFKYNGSPTDTSTAIKR